MAKARSQYRCSECHHVTAKWVGRCSDCGTWGTVDEVAVLAAVNGSAVQHAPIQCIKQLEEFGYQPLVHGQWA